jgi:phage gpG-like protein
MFTITFKPWRRFFAFRDRRVTSRFMAEAAREFEEEYRKSIRNPPKTGRIYRRKHGLHQASRPRTEYPANETGALQNSVTSQSTQDTATIGTTMFYGKYLREGTRKMARRKMSDNIVRENTPRILARLRGWVVWKRI